MMMPAQTMFQSIQGPSDSGLRSNQIEGYTQVSRVGEQVINAFGAHSETKHAGRQLSTPPTLTFHVFVSQSMATSSTACR